MGRMAACVLGFAAALFPSAIVSGGCGGEGGGSQLAHGENVRGVLTTILVAAVSGDVATAGPHLNLQEFSGVYTDGKPRPLDQLTPAEKADLTSTCFNQAIAVRDGTTLRDAASISAALAAGTTTVHERIHKAEVQFQGPSADGGGKVLHFVANLTLGSDNRWRLVTLQEKFR